jgi:hypothetical protein
MSQSAPRQYSDSTLRTIAGSDSIEWEEMPSLAKRVVHRGAHAGGQDSRFGASTLEQPWGETVSAGLDPAPVSEPLTERLDGLDTREVIEPDVFQYFFGPNAD